MKTDINRCYECGGEMQQRSFYCWEDKFLGKMEVNAEAGEYFYCAECGSEELSYSLMKKIESVEQERIEQLLLQRVGGSMKAYKENLVRNKDLVALLGKSRQAIQQDHKIKTLIFHHIEKSGEIVYWKPSVELYKETGDGRFDLSSSESAYTDVSRFTKQPEHEETTNILAETVPITWSGSFQSGFLNWQDFPSQYEQLHFQPGFMMKGAQNG